MAWLPEMTFPIIQARLYCCILLHNVLTTGFIQTLESPGIKLLRFPGMESSGKDTGPGKPWKVLEF